MERCLEETVHAPAADAPQDQFPQMMVRHKLFEERSRAQQKHPGRE
ncbi:MAG: hypothetical protein H6562_14895 [Lewinellaceae bacterium]|nr:hypothetical protein [Lewinellaceae bacterium]